MLKFYVYHHIRPDTGEVFYVGKGSGDRLNSRYRRNSWWRNIVARHGFVARKVGLYIDEAEALRREIAAIAELRAAGVELVNMTDGGDGTTGHRHSEQTIAALSEMKKGQPRPRHVIQAMADARRGKKEPEHVRRKKSESATGRPMSAEAVAKVVAFHTGCTRSDESRRRMSEAQKSRARKPMSEAQRAAVDRMLAAKPKGPPSEETRRRMSEARRGKKRAQPMSEEARQNLSAALKAAWERRRAAAEAAAKQG